MNSTWSLVHAERAALAADLADLTDEQWATTSLCAELSVREVLAHLTAGAVLSFPRWFLGVLRVRFDFDRQVVDRLREQLGDSPAETLARFQAAVNRSTTPLGFRGSSLGALAEQVVHAEDIRRPLGIPRVPPAEVLVAVAEHYASTDLVVLAKGRIGGLRLVATDTGFATGEGSEVRGPTLALIMAMTGRAAACAELTGDGVAELRGRC
ncbi:maleylpyruvate isomerase family mycothiol-dependent enzyme [Lentzea sp. JNUCC 0626]|uniref:maleylpyruvate isomerase family mycothiol-dependent enzyme n=1 Tax=Lentzea sp. JNUCC 0626 TaxID=3367513 RepID=UPI003749C012